MSRYFAYVNGTGEVSWVDPMGSIPDTSPVPSGRRRALGFQGRLRTNLAECIFSRPL